MLITLALSMLLGVLALAPGTPGAAVGQTAGAPPAPPPDPPATPPALQPVASAVNPTTGGVLIASAANLAIQLPAGSVNQPVLAAIVPLAAQGATPAQLDLASQALASLNVPPPPALNNVAQQVVQVFQLSATLASGAEAGSFATPVTVGVDISPEVLALAGGNMANISLQFFDAVTREWIAVPSTAVGQTLLCQVPHFSLWALVARKASLRAAAPAAGQPGTAPRPAATGGLGPATGTARPQPPLIPAAASAVLLIGIGAGVAAHRRHRL